MSGQFPSTLHASNLAGNFLEQAVCNRSFSSLPTSSVTPTVSATFSSTWPNLTLSNEEKSDNNGSCMSENSSLEPEALMKLLSDADEPATGFFNHPPETGTTPTYSNKMTRTSTANVDINNDFSSCKNTSNSLSNISTARCGNQPNLNTSGTENYLTSCNSGKTSGNVVSKIDSTTSTNSTSTVSSSEVKKVPSNPTVIAEKGNTCNSSPHKPKISIVVKPKDPNASTNYTRKVVVTLKEPSSKTLVSKPVVDGEKAGKDNLGHFGNTSPTPVTINAKSSTNGVHTPKSTPVLQKEISPNPDNVESLLESMFQMSSNAKATEPIQAAVNSSQKTRALRAESVEKILKSPSPPSCFNGDCNLDAIMKSPTEKPMDVIKEEPKDNVDSMKNLEDKENSNAQRINGKTSSNDKPIKIFNEIESELEKMFAGIVEPETSKIKTELSSPVKSERSSKKIKNTRRSSENSILSSCSSNDLKKSKNSLKRRYDERKDVKHLSKKFKIDKDTSNDSFYAKLRGPVIHIEGAKDNPTSYTIINCRSKPEQDEETQDSKTSLMKKKSAQRINSSKTIEGNLETIRTTNEMWICLFCKKGPHVPGVGGDPSGDLFGPYYIKDKNAASSTSSDQKVKKKKKLADCKAAALHSEGILSVPNSNEYEVWVHENCCVWASGVYLVGAKLQGLEDAVWAACGMKCDHCGLSGASIGCVVRHCQSRVHYSCALRVGWHLDQETFIAKCNQHENSFLFSPSVSSS